MTDMQNNPAPIRAERSLLMLAIGGSSGFLLWVLSLVLAYAWRATIFGGLDAWQGPKWWQLWVCLLAIFGGLAIMFISLLPLRAFERSNVTLRRLLYGYNAVLTGLLVLGILLVANVLVYNYVTPSFDWTASGIYSLSDRSKNILHSLDKPTKVYAVVSSSSTMRELKALLDNCRAVNEKLQVEYVDPDLDISKMRSLYSTYQFDERLGLLIVYGEEGKAEHQVVKGSEIFAADPSSGRGDRFIFKGEDALMTALNYLEEGKAKSVVYFTQGNGELDINDSGSSQPGKGLGALRDRLQKANFEVKGLQLSPVAEGKSTNLSTVVSNKVPDDAEIVVVCGPRNQLPDFALKALRDYMNRPGDSAGKKKGKLFVLLDFVQDRAKNVVKTGLESLLEEFNVQIGSDRLLSLPTNLNGGDPLKVPVRADDHSQNPVAVAFRGGVMLMPDARPVQTQARNPNVGATPYTVETLMEARGQLGDWVETNVRADPSQIVDDLMKNEQEMQQKLNNPQPAPVMVAVGESQPPAGNDPHAFMRPPEQKPRAVVIGSASFACNRYMNESSPLPYYDLFASALSWLRERPNSIGLEPKKRNIFALNLRDDQLARMRWLPVTFMLIGIMGLGTGVWLIRRR
jgi:hypothetical protein